MLRECLLCVRHCVRLIVTVPARVVEDFTLCKSLDRILYVPSFQYSQQPSAVWLLLLPPDTGAEILKRGRQLAQGRALPRIVIGAGVVCPRGALTLVRREMCHLPEVQPLPR